MARAFRLGRAFLVLTAGIVLGCSLYVGLIRAGVVSSPFAPVLQGDIAAARSDRPGARVLFVGNSMTCYNAMPQMVEAIAAGDPGAGPLFVVSYTGPAWTLEGAAKDDRLAELIRDVRWDTVILQENTTRAQEPDRSLEHDSVPYAQDIERRVEARGAQPLLYMTWPGSAHEGLPALLGIPVAPVGPAIAEASFRRPDLRLLMEDGHHPNRAGSYLAACVFYGLVTRRNPSRSTYTGGIDPWDAMFLQRLAAELVR
jgi:hypothetical protein